MTNAHKRKDSKTNILGLEELKMLFRVKEERIFIFIKVKERNLTSNVIST